MFKKSIEVYPRGLYTTSRTGTYLDEPMYDEHQPHIQAVRKEIDKVDPIIHELSKHNSNPHVIHINTLSNEGYLNTPVNNSITYFTGSHRPVEHLTKNVIETLYYMLGDKLHRRLSVPSTNPQITKLYERKHNLLDHIEENNPEMEEPIKILQTLLLNSHYTKPADKNLLEYLKRPPAAVYNKDLIDWMQKQPRRHDREFSRWFREKDKPVTYENTMMDRLLADLLENQLQIDQAKQNLQR